MRSTKAAGSDCAVNGFACAVVPAARPPAIRAASTEATTGKPLLFVPWIAKVTARNSPSQRAARQTGAGFDLFGLLLMAAHDRLANRAANCFALDCISR
jgi:hypothetical protein